jgi:outer membrane protein OmpA-like peptidoglycan-associated protein
MNTKTHSLIALVATLAACSSAPERNDALEQARSRFDAARTNTQVASLAPDELKVAADAMLAADAAAKARSKRPTLEHLAYMATQRVTIAEETAVSRAAQAVTASAAAERDKMRLALRTAEADAAQRALTMSEQDSARSAAELAMAAQRNEARVSDLEAQLAELNAKKTDRGMVVTLGDVLFDTGKSMLRPGSNSNLAKLAEFFKRNPERKAMIEGYTDSVGSAGTNLALSQRRATAVMDALLGMGVTTGQLDTRAYGLDKPTADNRTAAGRQMNRRVEIVFASQDAEVAAN